MHSPHELHHSHCDMVSFRVLCAVRTRRRSRWWFHCTLLFVQLFASRMSIDMGAHSWLNVWTLERVPTPLLWKTPPMGALSWDYSTVFPLPMGALSWDYSAPSAHGHSFMRLQYSAPPMGTLSWDYSILKCIITACNMFTTCTTWSYIQQYTSLMTGNPVIYGMSYFSLIVVHLSLHHFDILCLFNQTC